MKQINVQKEEVSMKEGDEENNLDEVEEKNNMNEKNKKPINWVVIHNGHMRIHFVILALCTSADY